MVTYGGHSSRKLLAYPILTMHPSEMNQRQEGVNAHIEPEIDLADVKHAFPRTPGFINSRYTKIIGFILAAVGISNLNSAWTNDGMNNEPSRASSLDPDSIELPDTGNSLSRWDQNSNFSDFVAHHRGTAVSGWFNTEKDISLEALRGQVVVIKFWASWCQPCVAGIPTLNKMQKEFHNKGVVFLTMTDEGPEKIGRFCLSQEAGTSRLEAPTATGARKVREALDVPEIYPTYVVIDRAGKVVFKEAIGGSEEAETDLHAAIAIARSNSSTPEIQVQGLVSAGASIGDALVWSQRSGTRPESSRTFTWPGLQELTGDIRSALKAHTAKGYADGNLSKLGLSDSISDQVWDFYTKNLPSGIWQGDSQCRTDASILLAHCIGRRVILAEKRDEALKNLLTVLDPSLERDPSVRKFLLTQFDWLLSPEAALSSKERKFLSDKILQLVDREEDPLLRNELDIVLFTANNGHSPEWGPLSDFQNYENELREIYAAANRNEKPLPQEFISFNRFQADIRLALEARRLNPEVFDKLLAEAFDQHRVIPIDGKLVSTQERNLGNFYRWCVWREVWQHVDEENISEMTLATVVEPLLDRYLSEPDTDKFITHMALSALGTVARKHPNEIASLISIDSAQQLRRRLDGIKMECEALEFTINFCRHAWSEERVALSESSNTTPILVKSAQK